MARTLQFQSNLPPQFWGDCVSIATYIINHLPLSCLNFISPYEKLYGQKPTNTHLKVFGCLCFVSTIKQGRNKLDTRAQPAIFLGYPHGQKAHKVFNLVIQQIAISRDIIFHEHHFPYHISTNFSSPSSRIYLPTPPDIPSFESFSPLPSCPIPIPISPSTTACKTPCANPDQVLDLTAQPSSHTNLRTSIEFTNLPPTSRTTTNHWCNLINTSSFSSKQKSIMASHISWHEPSTFTQAVKNPNGSKQWKPNWQPCTRIPLGTLFLCLWVRKLSAVSRFSKLN